MQTDIMLLTSGKWPSILESTAKLPPEALSGKHGPCPLCGGTDRFRFIDVHGSGRWICNQCGTGDGMDLFMRVTGLSFDGAAELLRPKAMCFKSQPPPKRKTKEEQHRIMKELAETWEGAAEDHELLHAYLTSRKLERAAYGGADLRLHPDLPLFDEDRKMIGKFPCMLARIVNLENKVACLHRTYLKELRADGTYLTEKKTTVTARDWKGGAIRLFSARGQKRLIVSEGIETGLSVRQRILKKSDGALAIPVWAAISAGGMERFVIPAGLEIDLVIIAGDNDASYTGQKAAYTLANRLAVQGPRGGLGVQVRIPLQGGDWNDFIDDEVAG